MDVPLEPPPFLVLRRHESRASGAKLFDEQDVAQHQTGLRGQILNQPLFRAGQWLVGGHGNRERAEEVALMPDGEHAVHLVQGREFVVPRGEGHPRARLGRRRRPAGGQTILGAHMEPDLRALGPRPGAEDLDHPRQYVIGRVGPPHALNKARQ